MAKNRNLQPNSEVNFVLKGVNSIQIGIYFLLFAYFTKNLLDGFLSDSSMLGMMSIEIIESMLVFFGILVVFFSYFALFFSSRRAARKNKIKFWSGATKATFWVTFLLATLVLIALSLLNDMGLFSELTAIFFLLYGTYLLLFNFRKKKQLQLFGALCLGLAVLTFVIPTYWYNAVLILGVGHVVYGLMVKR